MIIHQWLPAAHRGDAVGDHARAIRDLLRAWGHDSEIFALQVDEDLADEVRRWSDPESRDGDVTLLHYAIPSPMTQAMRTLPGARVLYYHNVTPARFFAPFDAGIYRLAKRGREELRDLVGRVDLALGVSDYNRRELEALGFEPTGVLPIAVDTARLTGAPRLPALEAPLADGLANILFVGRYDAVPRYYRAVRGMIDEFRMRSDRFWFPGPVPDAELAAYYRHAHAYVSLSEHEGFCVPLVEAMAMDVPVLAYASSAVPETLGGAGLSFAPKDLELAAELLGALVYDEALRQQVLAGQRRRVQEFSRARFADRLRHVLAPFAA